MTNDNDKLRRLREKLVAEARISEDSRGYDSGKASPLWMLDEIDRLLNEPTSPAPAAAPSEAGMRHVLDRAKALRGTVDGWPKLIEEIEAMAAKPPVTSEEIEAAIDGIEHMSPRAKQSLRDLIARRLQQATDAELHREFVGGMAAMADLLRDRGVITHKQWEDSVYAMNNVDHAHKAAGRQEWNNLHAACARMRRGVAAAEELARAAAEYRTMVRPQHGECECAATAEKLDDALAAFRAAQGGGK